MGKKYISHQNFDGSYTTYEEDVRGGPNVTLWFFVISIFIYLSPIWYFVTKHFIEKYNNHPKIKWLKIINRVTLVIFIVDIIVWVALIAVLALHLLNVVHIPLIAELFH